MEFGSPLEVLAKNLGGRYTADYIMQQHTILSYYTPFLPSFRREEIIREVKHDNCNGIYTQIGIVAGSICKKEGIYYCPVCAKNEIESKGEAFIHREHQLQGINLCVHHGVLLKIYKQDKKQLSRLEFIRLENKLLDLKDNFQGLQHYEKRMMLAKAAYYVLNTDFKGFDKAVILGKYRNLLYKKGLTTASQSVKQNDLYEEFINYYGNDFLETLESSIDNNDEYNWLRVITRNLKRVVHPLRHLLFINFLADDISEFFEDRKSQYNPFGKGPWPCLNKVAEHYLKNVVRDLKITEDYKTRVPVGTFSCECGFVYSRKGPDKAEEDRYKIGRIKNFGKVWEDKLKGYLEEGKYGLRELARLMYCDPKTISKFDNSLVINYFHPATAINISSDKEIAESKLELYKKAVIDTMKDNKKASRVEIRALCGKEYAYIYRYDKTWLNENLPRIKKVVNHKKRVDWTERDNEVLSLVKVNYQEMMKDAIPVRINKSSIGKRSGILSTLEKNLNKLPQTEKYLQEITETVEEFQLRRCKKIIKEKIEENSEIRFWEIQRLAAIRSNQFEKIKKKLKEYIKNEFTGG